MTPENRQGLYKRVLMLGVLSIGLAVLGFSADTESVYAARCIQDCQADVDRCDDQVRAIV